MYNQGPERSILGAAGLPRVLTVGASTVHDDWIGTSSQGDAPDTLKGIGWFAENLDPKQTNTGTSASCGVAAGVVASLISDGSDFDGISPEDLFKELRDTAFETQQGWDRRTGHGRIRFPQVSGGASGIGQEIVRAFAAQGAKVGFVDMDVDGGTALASELGAAFAPCDLRDIPAMQAAFDTVTAQTGAPVVLVNNAARDAPIPTCATIFSRFRRLHPE